MICNGGEIAGRPENYGRAVSGRWEKVSEDPPHQREKSKIQSTFANPERPRP